MVSVLDSRSSGPGLSPGRAHSVVFLGKTLNSHSASPHYHFLQLNWLSFISLEEGLKTS